MARNILVDRLKGYACFLVLFGHVIMGMRNAGIPMPEVFFSLETFIWSFHVPLFLFLSGAVYKLTGEWQSKNTKSNFIKHKLLNLGIPYIIFSVVYILINSFVGQTNTESSLFDILYLWKTPVAQYWFLYVLFFLFCIWTVLSGTFKNWQITLGLVLLGYLAPAFDLQFGSFDAVIYSALAFGLGTCVDIPKIINISDKIKLLIILFHIILGAVLIYTDLMEYPIIKETITVLGIYSSILLITLLQNFKPVADFLNFMNKYSFQTYLLHTIFTAGIRIILLRLSVNLWWIHIILGCACGIFFSVLAAVISKKIKALDACFFPGRYL